MKRGNISARRDLAQETRQDAGEAERSAELSQLSGATGRAAITFCVLSLLTCGSIALAASSHGELTPDESNTTAVFENVEDGVVHVEARIIDKSPYEEIVVAAGAGSGFFVDHEGRILTSYHIVNGMNEVDVVLSGGRRYHALLVGTAPQLDLALLQIDAPEGEIRPIPMGNSKTVRVGQKAIAIGNPVGLHNTITVGVISGVNRDAGMVATDLDDALIQIDAPLNPGNSGGPLLNSAGEVIGINAAIFKGTESVGFAVPIHLARRVIPDLIEMGHAYRPQLGFSGSTLDANIATLLGIPLSEGFLIEEVLPGSPAEAAGLKAGKRIVVLGEKAFVLGGDIITHVNARPVKSAAQIAQALIEGKPGDVLHLSVSRVGQIIEIEIPLQEMRMQF